MYLYNVQINNLMSKLGIDKSELLQNGGRIFADHTQSVIFAKVKLVTNVLKLENLSEKVVEIQKTISK